MRSGNSLYITICNNNKNKKMYKHFYVHILLLNIDLCKRHLLRSLFSRHGFDSRFTEFWTSIRNLTLEFCYFVV